MWSDPVTPFAGVRVALKPSEHVVDGGGQPGWLNAPMAAVCHMAEEPAPSM